MRVYNYDHCGHLVFFDSVQCMHCGSALAFLPDRLTLGALAPAPETGHGLWRRLDSGSSGAPGALYRPCYNHTAWGACNFAVPAGSPHLLCVACRQTQRLPDLSEPLHRLRWARIEGAKRQLFYTLARLGPQSTDQLAPARARLRVALHEPYRTLIGHLRHESGHFYWDRLVQDGGRLDAFRAVFGDERQDYATALQAHYTLPARADWSLQHVSAYAAAHPWENWAETWAHYLHMVDLLETAAAYATGLSVPETRTPAPPREHVADPFGAPAPGFDTMVRQWVPLTLLLNSLNRSLGQQDAYPFALSPGALRKLRFVHDLVAQATAD